MISYIAKRFVQIIVVLLIVSLAIFLLARLTGDPLTQLLSVFATPEDYAKEKERWGLDKPLYVQYFLFVANAAKGNFGKSIITGMPVSELIAGKLINSAKLVGVGFLLSIFISFPLAVIAAVKKGSIWDGIARLIAGLGQSVPSFWLGLMLMYVFSLKLNWLPATGMKSIANYIMPSVVTASFLMAGFIRLLRSSMLDVLGSDFIKMARIKGVPEHLVILKHALANSLLPMLGYGGVYVSVCVTTSIMVEVVFAWPGFGRLVYEAIMSRDYPLIQGVVMVGSMIVLTANLITDILYAFVDPRIRY